jgi:hypothetical protein
MNSITTTDIIALVAWAVAFKIAYDFGVFD